MTITILTETYQRLLQPDPNGSVLVGMVNYIDHQTFFIAKEQRTIFSFYSGQCFSNDEKPIGKKKFSKVSSEIFENLGWKA